MSKIAIRVDNLSKQYRIGGRESRYETLRDRLAASFKGLSHFTDGHPSSANRANDTFWALKNISFEVKQGDVVGIIGRNGAGKSTLLKILSRITEPTEGRAKISGRVGSLLEVGTGFHGELSGRENIYLNGAILGMKKAEIDRKFDEMVDFSGVEKFIDTPVKRYSSGMYVRLAFAVAAHLEPDIMIVDEVLAVGDLEFQKKCLGKMREVAEKDRTLLFVSHNMSAILRLCPETLLLEEGQIALRGPSASVVERYMSLGISDRAEKRWRAEEVPSTCGPFRPMSVRVVNGNKAATDLVLSSQPFSIEIEYKLVESIRDFRVGIYLYASTGELVFMSFDRDDLARHERYIIRAPGHYVSRCHIPANLLNSGTYVVGMSVSVPNAYRFFMDYSAVKFTVDTTGGIASQWAETRGGLLRPALEWEIKRGKEECRRSQS